MLMNDVTPDHEKYKVFAVFNLSTQEYEGRVYGMGKELPYKPLQKVKVGGMWWRRVEGKRIRFERLI
jgi:hypothetical protein